MTQSKYGFSIGDIVKTLVPLTSSDGELQPDGKWRRVSHEKGTLLKIVAIAPKVGLLWKPDNITTDSKEYFYNAVPLDSNTRVRENFCTIEHIYRLFDLVLWDSNGGVISEMTIRAKGLKHAEKLSKYHINKQNKYSIVVKWELKRRDYNDKIQN